MIKLSQKHLYPLTDTTEHLLVLWHIPSCDHQQLGFIRKRIHRLRAAISRISQQNASICHQAQINRCVTVVTVASCQHRCDYLPVDIEEGVQLEAEEPPLARLAKISACLTQRAHAAVTNGLADRDGLGIYQVKREFEPISSPGRLNQMADDVTQLMKAGDPLFVRAESGESWSKVVTDNLIRLLQGGYPETTLHQADSNDFGVCENGLGVRRMPPSGQLRMSFKEIINEAIDLSHLIYNGSQAGRPPGAKCLVKTLLHLRRPYFSTQDSR